MHHVHLHRIGDAIDEMLGGRMKMELQELVDLAVEFRRDAPSEADLDRGAQVRNLFGLVGPSELDDVLARLGLVGENVHRGLEQAMIEAGKRVVVARYRLAVRALGLL